VAFYLVETGFRWSRRFRSSPGLSIELMTSQAFKLSEVR